MVDDERYFLFIGHLGPALQISPNTFDLKLLPPPQPIVCIGIDHQAE